MRTPSKIQSLLKSENGTILVFWGVSFAVLFGIIALSFDIGRISATQSELQSYADHVALAAAGELDGNDDAITRAMNAANSLISDTQTFGSGATTLAGSSNYGLTFYATLPDSDTDAMNAPTTDPADATYARVAVVAQTVDLTFAAAFSALTGTQTPNNQTTAVAVAGFTQFACDITPLMFCIPNQSFSAETAIGNMILLRSGGAGAAWGPGDFGFLDPNGLAIDDEGPCGGLTGANLTKCLIGAEENITRCFAQKGVETEPGQKVGIENAAFNVRFDIYAASMNGKKNDPNYRPAPNVIKGIVPNGGGMCIGGNEQDSANTLGLPHDDCFTGGGCARFGDGNWSASRVDYVATNYYGGPDPHPAATTRYEYYLAEIEAAGGGFEATNILTGVDEFGNPKEETGRPVCSINQSPDPERRVVIAAGIDCTANPINGHETDVPVKEFVELFITQPVGSDGGSPPTFDFWVEVIGPAGGAGGGAGGTGGTFRDVVQLYR